MADENRKSEGKQGFIDSLLNPPKCSMLRMIVIGIVGGIVIWGGLNMGMEYTNRSDFCMSCHEMTIPFEELKKTVHYKNRSGTTVQCADCHVASVLPRGGTDLVVSGEKGISTFKMKQQ